MIGALPFPAMVISFEKVTISLYPNCQLEDKLFMLSNDALSVTF